MVPRRWGLVMAALLAGLAARPAPARAQDWFLDVALDQSFTTDDPLRAPGGFTISAGGIAIWGPLGLHASYRDLSDGGDQITQDCTGITPCVPGSFFQSFTTRTAALGVSYDFINPTNVMLTLALTGGSSWQSESLEGSTSTTRERIGSNFSLGATTHLRLRPMVAGIRPEFAVRYDRNWGIECVANAPCSRSRNAFGFSVGFGWVLRSPHDY